MCFHTAEQKFAFSVLVVLDNKPKFKNACKCHKSNAWTYPYMEFDINNICKKSSCHDITISFPIFFSGIQIRLRVTVDYMSLSHFLASYNIAKRSAYICDVKNDKIWIHGIGIWWIKLASIAIWHVNMNYDIIRAGQEDADDEFNRKSMEGKLVHITLCTKSKSFLVASYTSYDIQQQYVNNNIVHVHIIMIIHHG